MRLFLLCIVLSSLTAFAAEMPDADAKFKKANLSQLHAHDPGAQSNEDALWKKFIDLSIRYEDREIMKRIFQVEKETDGEAAEQYPLDLYEIYKAKPIFFLKSAERYYPGGLKAVAVLFINEKEDFTIQQMYAPLKTLSDPVVQKFQKILALKQKEPNSAKP